MDAVDADLKDLGVQLFEFFVVLTEPVDLVLSAACEGGRVEGHDDSTAGVGAELDVHAGVGREFEVRGLVARLQCWHLGLRSGRNGQRNVL